MMNISPQGNPADREETRADQIELINETDFRSLAENSQDFITRFDSQFRIVYKNPAAIKSQPIPVDDLYGSTYRELGYSAEQCDLWDAAIREVFESGKSKSLVITDERDGVLLTYDWRIYPEIDHQGKVRHVLGITRDISDLVRIQHALQHAHDELEKRVAERTRNLEKVIDLMVGREIRMVQLKKVIDQLRSQLLEAGMEPQFDDPLRLKRDCKKNAQHSSGLMPGMR
jgi:PAS domain S-box-containing protein